MCASAKQFSCVSYYMKNELKLKKYVKTTYK